MELGPSEIVVILLVALLLYGGKLPELARTMGRWVGKFRRAYDDIQYEIRREVSNVTSAVEAPDPAAPGTLDAVAALPPAEAPASDVPAAPPPPASAAEEPRPAEDEAVGRPPMPN